MNVISFLPQLQKNQEKLRELSGYLCNKYRAAVTDRTNQVDGMYQRWHNNYSAKPKEEVRTTPFYNASNFVPQMIRMHTDILSARLTGIIFGTKPLWRPKNFLPGLPHETMEVASEWLEYVSYSEIEIFDPLDMGVFLSCKNGTNVWKGRWDESELMLVSGDPESPTATPYVKEKFDLQPISFDDFWPYPLTARNGGQCLIKFHRLRFAKEEIEYRKARQIWDPKACDALLNSTGSIDSNPKRQSEEQDAGLNITIDSTRPFNVIEAWLNYPLTNAGDLTPIIVTFNPHLQSAEGILKGLYNPYMCGQDIFVDSRLMPRDDNFYGYSVPEILEQSQEEQAQIHNARRDANTIAMVPGWKKRSGANEPTASVEWYPSKVFLVEQMDDIEPLQFSSGYNAMIEEEQFLIQQAERYTGVGPPMQGMGAGTLDGQRGIYNSQGTMAVLSEGNKRLDIFLRRLRYPLNKVGRLIWESYGSRNKMPELDAFGDERSQMLKTLWAQTKKGNYNSIFFDIGASEAGSNKELDRTNLLLMANTMASYYRQVVEAASVIAQIPDPNHPLRAILLGVLTAAKDLSDRLLFYYDIGDRERLVPDVPKLLGGGSQPPTPAAQPGRVPPAEEPVSVGQLRDLSSSIATIAGSRTQ